MKSSASTNNLSTKKIKIRDPSLFEKLFGIDKNDGVTDCCINEPRPLWCYRGRIVSFSPYERSMKINYINSFQSSSMNDRMNPLFWFFFFLGFFIMYVAHQIVLMCIFGPNTTQITPDMMQVDGNPDMYLYFIVIVFLAIIGCIIFYVSIPNIGILMLLHTLVYICVGVLLSGMTLLLWDDTLFVSSVAASFFVIIYGMIISFFPSNKKKNRRMMLSITIIYLVVPVIIAYFNKFDVFYWLFAVGAVQAMIFIYAMFIKEHEINPIIATFKPFCDIFFIPCFFIILPIYTLFVVFIKLAKHEIKCCRKYKNDNENNEEEQEDYTQTIDFMAAREEMKNKISDRVRNNKRISTYYGAKESANILNQENQNYDFDSTATVGTAFPDFRDSYGFL